MYINARGKLIMRKVFISIDECKPGMQVAESIFNEYWAVIVAKDIVLTEFLINRIRSLGVSKIKVYEFDENIIYAKKSELFKAQYNENVEVIKDIISDITSGKKINIEKVNSVSESIIIRINENSDIIDCINQVRAIDEYTYSHSINVSLLSMLTGKWLRMDFQSVKLLVLSGLLHDIGKSKISRELLDKPAPLTEDEFEEIKRHSVYGLKIIEKMPGIDENIKQAVMMHHERNDGSGYPLGLKANQIHKFAHIIAVVDIYDAMTHDRVYKSKQSPFEVFEMLEKNAYGLLDIRVTRAFLSNIAAYYVGDFVLLNTGEVGEIVYINPRHISKPVVRTEDRFIDLSTNYNIKIKELVL